MTTAREETWREYASCAQAVDPAIFHPPKGGSSQPAKRVCAACDVSAMCLAYSLAHREKEGIWGGTTPEERKRMRKDRAA